MSKMFTIKASEAHGRRLDPEYHHALRRTRIRSTYPSAKLLSLSYSRTGNWFSTDLYEREGKAQANFAMTMPSDGYDFALQFAKCYTDVEVQFAANSSRMAKDEVPQRIAAMSGSFRLKEVV